MKTFEQFVNEKNDSHIGATTIWTNRHKRKDITLSLKDVNNYLDQQKIPIEYIDPKSVEHLLINVGRDPQRVENANLEFPIILVKKNGEYTKILDGQHRVFKCLKNKIDKIKCRILNLDNAPQKYQYLFEQFVNNDVIIKKVDWEYLKDFLKNHKLTNADMLTNLNNVSKDIIFKDYIILIALNDNTIVGYFYKYIGGNENFYDNGFVQSDMKGIGSKLLIEMKKYGHYTTFCNINNISSLKMHFKSGASKIICITDGSPSKEGNASKYNKEITNKEYENILKSGKLYYFNGTEKCLLFENGKINNNVINFILNNNNIDLISNNKKIVYKSEQDIDLKYYLLY